MLDVTRPDRLENQRKKEESWNGTGGATDERPDEPKQLAKVL